MNQLYKSTIEIALRKMAQDDTPSIFNSPRLGTGGNFVNIFLWDTAFSVMWAKYHTDIFPVGESLDNFYKVQYDSGFISRESQPNGTSRWSVEHPIAFAPPLLAWTELELYEGEFITDRLPRVYPHLLKQHQFNMKTYIRPDGLFFSDFLGCGMDDMPRWDDVSDIDPDGGIPFSRDLIKAPEMEKGKTWKWLMTMPKGILQWNRQLGWCDTSCQMAFNALILSRIATVLGKADDAIKLKQEHDRIADKVNELCWDDKKLFYFDRLDNKLLSRRHIGAYWALLGEVAPPDRAEALIADLKNPAHFNRPCGIPCLSADDREYMVGYWRGPAWCPTTYMTLRGLRVYGEEKLAREIAEKFYHAVKCIWEKTGTIWENYSPEQCEKPSKHAQKDFCGWSALAPITIYREFLS